jgi:hypothetical protein
VFYLFAATVSFYTGHHILGAIFLTIAVTSVIHHSNRDDGLSPSTWGKIDVAMATIGSLIILIYGIWKIFVNRKHDVLKSKRTYMIGVVFVLVALLALTIFGFAGTITSGLKTSDPNRGLTGPLSDATAPGSVPGVDINQICYDRSLQTQYLIYHTIWHILGGIVGIFFVTLITLN